MHLRSAGAQSNVCRAANLGPPLPGQPGPFCLGAPGQFEQVFIDAGFADVRTELIAAPVRLASAGECLRFERQSFGALHQMLSGLDDAGRAAVWSEIASSLEQFEGPSGFEGPCELIGAVGTKRS